MIESKSKDYWWWTKDKKWTKTDNLFSIKKPKNTDGITPHSINAVITMREPRDFSYFDPGLGEGGQFTSGTKKRIFNHHFGSGKYIVTIMCRSNPKGNERFWQSESFEVKVKTKKEARREDPNCVITNFFQGAGGGQFSNGAVGLDVDFTISWEEKPKSIEWVFSDNMKEKDRTRGPLKWPVASSLASVDHTYTELGHHDGFVKVISNKEHECIRKISVDISDIE